MKSLIVFVLSLISLASCQETFQFPTNGTACIRATFEAQFDLTFTDSNGTHEASFDLPAFKDVEVDGNCPEDNIATLNLTFTMEETSLVFTFTNNSGQISGDIQFVLMDPSKTFPQVNYSSPVSLNGPDQEFSQMGQVNNSYMCHAEENFTLSSSNQSDISASVNISFMNVQFQAFDLPTANFSSPFDCAEDHPSSTTMSTTILTTTLPTPTGVGEYVVKNGSEVCLRMKANITISVKYENKNGTMVTHDVMIPENADVNGTCGDSEITMNFMLKPEGEFEYEFEDAEFGGGELTFVFMKDKGFSFIQECKFELHFNDTNTTISKDQTTNDVLALSSKPYTCNTETLKVEMDEVVLRNLTVQAFDLSDGNFSKNAMDCHKLPPETPPSQNYTVSEGNTTCISMSVALALKITYETT